MKSAIRAFATAVTVLLGATSAAVAGTVYVPIPGVTTIGNSGYQLVVTATNTTNHSIEIQILTFTSGVDGTKREGKTPSKQSQYPCCCWCKEH